MTRVVYRFEDRFLPSPEWPMARLRALGRLIWREIARGRERCPEIVAGRGLRHCGRLVSYCEGRSRVVLARHERRPRIVIHEFTHALGPITHGLRFQKLFAYLIGRYL